MELKLLTLPGRSENCLSNADIPLILDIRVPEAFHCAYKY